MKCQRKSETFEDTDFCTTRRHHAQRLWLILGYCKLSSPAKPQQKQKRTSPGVVAADRKDTLSSQSAVISHVQHKKRVSYPGCSTLIKLYALVAKAFAVMIKNPLSESLVFRKVSDLYQPRGSSGSLTLLMYQSVIGFYVIIIDSLTAIEITDKRTRLHGLPGVETASTTDVAQKMIGNWFSRSFAKSI